MDDGDYVVLSDSGNIKTIAIVVLAVIASAFFVAFIVTYTQSNNPPKDSESYTYCQARPECVQTPLEFQTAFSAASTRSGFYGPACVHDTILGRVVAVSGNTNKDWTITTLGRVGFGSRIAFSISANTLEKILVLGDQDATSIVRTLGYGDSYTCGTPAYNYTDCQYRLILWTAACLNNRPPITQGYWPNLEWFLQTYVYGSATPSLSNAITQIQNAKGLLQTITGCNSSLTPNNYWDKSSQIAAGCTDEFISAMDYFARSPCNGSTSTTPTYTPTAGCTAESRFLNLNNPTAVQLRAYLMQNEGFNPYYTGYGYTANGDFYNAQQEEYWYPNDSINNLSNSVIIKFYNGTQ